MEKKNVHSPASHAGDEIVIKWSRLPDATEGEKEEEREIKNISIYI